MATPRLGDPRLWMVALVGGILVVVASFVAVTVVVRRNSNVVAQAINVSENGEPSVRLLAEASGDLRAMRAAASRLADDVSVARVLDDLGRDRRSLRQHLLAEMETRNFPGEDEINREVADALSNLDAATLELAQAGDDAAARHEALRAFQEAAAVVDGRLGKLHQFNVAALRNEIDSLLAKQRAATPLLAWLDAASVLLAALVTLGLIQLFRRHVALERQRRSLLEERATELDAFASRVAHDLKSPLSVVALALGASASELRDEKTRKLNQRAGAAVANMGSMIDGLFALARAGGKPHPGSRAFVPRVAARVVEEMQPKAELEEIELSCQPMPSCEVACDPGVLAVLLTNLISNSIKFMGDRATRRIVVRAHEVGEFVRFEVEDTGIGLPLGFDALAFKPYVRASAARPGLGLGLATVKRVVDGHGGAVGVASREGQGSTFWFLLPRAP